MTILSRRGALLGFLAAPVAVLVKVPETPVLAQAAPKVGPLRVGDVSVSGLLIVSGSITAAQIAASAILAPRLRIEE